MFDSFTRKRQRDGQEDFSPKNNQKNLLTDTFSDKQRTKCLLFKQSKGINWPRGTHTHARCVQLQHSTRLLGGVWVGGSQSESEEERKEKKK